MQEIQEMQERPYGATDKAAGLSFAYWHVADVPVVQGELLPAGVWGSAPHPIILSSNLPIPFVSFVVLCVLCGKSTLAVLRAVARP